MSELRPTRAVHVLNKGDLTVVNAGDITPKLVGLKAYGLAAIPPVWTRPFFVVTADFVRETNPRELGSWLCRAVAEAGLHKDGQFLVRSSGIAETIEQRGSLVSETATLDSLAPTLLSLADRIPPEKAPQVHWIIQELVATQGRGQLSNERRLRREKRDWLLEVEPSQVDVGSFQRIAHRPWRDGNEAVIGQLKCSFPMHLHSDLKPVAIWASGFSHRVLFEWVWDGTNVYIVQADSAEVSSGTEPMSLLQVAIGPPRTADLRAFRVPAEADYRAFRKLFNASLYGSIGYEMPPFYLLDDAPEIEAIMAGVLTENLRSDLIELTKRPLIVRTDGKNIPDEYYAMLPRSEELRSLAAAEEWLLGPFRAQIAQHALTGAQIAIVAHHFIPSVAAAWARAEPGRRFVRIESLWGLPEGLYYFAHDTYEIDTGDVAIPSGGGSFERFRVLKRRQRYKGTLICPDKDGRWNANQVLAPADWAFSVSEDAWLFEIASTTRLIAEREGHAVSVMWFVENHPEATQHRILPWFHFRSDISEPPRAAPRRKHPSVVDFRVTDDDSWQVLQDEVRKGRRIERIVIDPKGSSLIRNPDFANALGSLASNNNIVVELSGGILSHAYFILQRAGARVEFVDLFAVDEDVVEYNKLVRDEVADAIIEHGERAQTVKLTGNALVVALKQKLVEEALEAFDAEPGEELIGELADVMEVLLGISDHLGLSIETIESERREKQKTRGGFSRGLMLTQTSTPTAITTSEGTPTPGDQLTISEPQNIPSTPVYRRPDLRQPSRLELEKLFTLETAINSLRPLDEVFDFEMPYGDSSSEKVSLHVSIRRERGNLRCVIRLRKAATQLKLSLDDPQLTLDLDI